MSTVFSRDLYMRAWRFAATRHNAQKMSGSELPYVTHVGAVAMEVLATIAIEDFENPDLAVACALLHDTVEDTATTSDEIAAAFGAAVAEGVLALSKDKAIPKDGQMADSLRRIQKQPREVWLVKLADRAVNMEPAPASWSVKKRRAYHGQASVILEQLGSASPSLAARLREKIARYEECIVRTSVSHPLRIAWLETPSGWRVGLTFAPGKRGPSREGYLWKRDLGADLDLLAREGIRTIACLVEAHELVKWGIDGLPSAAAARGIELLHRPIRDVSVPTLDDARSLVGELIARREAPMLIHCVGGLGRTGVIAGCLLRALDIAPGEALRRLVAARGDDCPQNEKQRRFVRGFTYPGPIAGA
jgi:protein-tyrosine phosphatase